MDKLYFFFIASALVVISGSIMIFSLESGQPDSEINSMLDAVWWTVATVTTVGYGDIVPVTELGRIVAIFYMFFGITFLAISLSVLGTRFYKTKIEDQKEISHAQKLILDRIAGLEKSQEALQKDLKGLIDELKRNLK